MLLASSSKVHTADMVPEFTEVSLNDPTNVKLAPNGFRAPTAGAVIKATRAELEADLQPFRAAVAVGAGGLMTAHVAYPALDATGLVASVSEPILQGLARRELGFNGLILTDAIEMRGLTPQISEKDAALAAFMAGADLLMGPTNPLEILNHLGQALSYPNAKMVEARARLLDSYRRIMTTKYGYKIAPPQY